jgi:hypothetical protein
MTKIVLVISFCFAFMASYAQAPLANAPMTPEDSALMIKRKKYINLKNGMQLNLNESGSHYIKFTFLAQLWTRYNQNNPGTTVNGQPSANHDGTFDIGLRRYRMQLYGKITDRLFFYTQLGQNSITFQSERKFGFFVHDAVVEYAIKPGKVNGMLNLGVGLTGWTGYGRFSSPAVAGIMGTDAPIFQQYGNDQNDQFVRKYSVYAHGTVSRLHYRVALSKPFIVNNPANPAIPGGQTGVPALGATSINGKTDNIATYATADPSLQTQGYFVYQFFDREDFLVPYNPGTYHGSKKILSVGAGFVYQPRAMWYTQTNSSGKKDTAYAAMQLFAVDVIYDAPVNKERGDAISLYAGYFNANYGPNYVRMFNAMNPGDAKSTSGSYNSGGGNSFPMYGSGQMLYAQAGYMFKKNLFGEEFGTLMPYASAQWNKLDALSSPVGVFNMGVNWLIRGHNAKISFDYQNRPFFQQNADKTAVEQTGRYGTFVLQYQMSF